MSFADEAGSMDLVGEHDEGAKSARGMAARRPNRRQQIGRTVGAGQRRVAHRARHHHRRVSVDEQVEGKRRLLDRVGPLGHDHPIVTGGKPALDLHSQRRDVGQRQLR